MIRMKCPTCARAIGIDEAYVGKPALCPNCHGTFTVPAPATLLDEAAAPSSVPLGPLPARTHPPGEPLFPDGPIPLAPEFGSPPPSFEPGGDDLWTHSEPRLKPLGPEVGSPFSPGPSSATGTGIRPQRQPPEPVPPPKGKESGDWEIQDWQFLALDGTAPASPPPLAKTPADEAPLPLLPELPDLSAAPELYAEASEPLLLPLEPEPEPLVTLTLEPAQPLVAEVVIEAAAPLVAEPVFEYDGPVHLPARVEPLAPAGEPALLLVPEAAVAAVGIVPPEAVVPSYDMLPTNLPPPLPAQPRPGLLAEPVWGSDEDNFQRQARERDPSRPRKQRRSYGAVTLVPGLDDFYLGLIFLGVVWLALAVLVIVSPRSCMVPIIVGGLIWVSATFWLNLSVQEADPYWKILFFTPIVTTPLAILFQTRGVFVLGFVITQLWAAFFAVYFRDRALRAFLVTCLGMVISGMGWAAMPRGPAEPLDNQAPFVGGR